MFQDMTQDPSGTYLPGMTPGEHEGADANTSFGATPNIP